MKTNPCNLFYKFLAHSNLPCALLLILCSCLKAHHFSQLPASTPSEERPSLSCLGACLSAVFVHVYGSASIYAGPMLLHTLHSRTLNGSGVSPSLQPPDPSLKIVLQDVLVPITACFSTVCWLSAFQGQQKCAESLSCIYLGHVHRGGGEARAAQQAYDQTSFSRIACSTHSFTWHRGLQLCCTGSP